MEDNVKYIESAALKVYNLFNSLEERIIEKLDEKLRREGKLREGVSLKDILDEDVKGYGIKVRDAIFLPKIEINDILPEEYHFSPIPALGVTYLNTGIVAIDPKARVADYIIGEPVTLEHELTHNMSEIQNLPLAMATGMETWASLPMLGHLYITDLAYHPYFQAMRDVSRIMFNFDPEKELEEVLLPLASGIKIDREKAKSYMDRLYAVEKIIKRVAYDEYFPEFFSNPLYWMAVDKWLDDNPMDFDCPSFRIFFYTKFEPSCLGGPEKTREFITKNRARIYSIAKEAYNEIRESEKSAGDKGKKKEMVLNEIKGYLDKMPPELKGFLLSFFRKRGMAKSEDELIDVIYDMYTAGILKKSFMGGVK